jgi:hypothetical protein
MGKTKNKDKDKKRKKEKKELKGTKSGKVKKEKKEKKEKLKVRWSQKATGAQVRTRTATYTPTAAMKEAGPSHKGTKLGKDWNPANMKQAWLDLLDPSITMSKTALSKKYHLPKNTFMDRCIILEKRKREGIPITDDMFGLLSGGKSTPRLFTPEEELELANHIVELARSGFPLEPVDFRSLAHEYALLNGKIVSTQTEQLSYNWYCDFLKRHPNIFITEPKEMCLYRAIAPNKANFNHFHDKYLELVQTLGIDEEHVWNVDESGLIDNPVSTTVLTERGSNLPYIVPKDKGCTTTVLNFINPAGLTSPVMVIMKGLNIQEKWKEFMPPYVHLRCSPTGWVNADLFWQFGHIFLMWLKRMKLDLQPNLVVMDGHGAHSYNHPFLILMQQHDISVLSLPPHSSHFLQPLDQIPFYLLKKRWKKNLRNYNRRNAAKHMNKTQFFLPFAKTWRESMNPTNIIAGWKKSGLWPIDRNRVSQDVFAPSELFCKTYIYTYIQFVDNFCWFFPVKCL